MDNLDQATTSQRSAIRRRKTLAKMMVSIAIIFGVCWGPHFMFFGYIEIGGNITENGFFIASVMELLPSISSCLNPFIYTINSKTFRNGLRTLFTRRQGVDTSTFRQSLHFTSTSVFSSKGSGARPKPRRSTIEKLVPVLQRRRGADMWISFRTMDSVERQQSLPEGETLV